MGPVRRADCAGGRPQRPLSGVGRHRYRDLGLLRRPGRDAGDDAHRRARRAAVAVSHHRTVLTDQGVAADRSQRHHRRHGHHRRVHRRLPQLQWADPGRNCAALRGARRTRLQHLLRRQVAPDATGGVQSGVHQAALADVARLRAVLRVHGRRDRPVVSGPGVRQPPGATAGDARGRLPPVEGHRRQDDRVHPRRQGDRARQTMVQLRLPRRRACPASRLQRVGGPLRRQVRHGLRALPRDRAGEAEVDGDRAAGHRAVAE